MHYSRAWLLPCMPAVLLSSAVRMPSWRMLPTAARNGEPITRCRIRHRRARWETVLRAGPNSHITCCSTSYTCRAALAPQRRLDAWSGNNTHAHTRPRHQRQTPRTRGELSCPHAAQQAPTEVCPACHDDAALRCSSSQCGAQATPARSPDFRTARAMQAEQLARQHASQRCGPAWHRWHTYTSMAQPTSSGCAATSGRQATGKELCSDESSPPEADPAPSRPGFEEPLPWLPMQSRSNASPADTHRQPLHAALSVASWPTPWPIVSISLRDARQAWAVLRIAAASCIPDTVAATCKHANAHEESRLHRRHRQADIAVQL